MATVFKLVGEVRCPYCTTKKYTVYHVPSQKNFFIWKISNFDRHLIAAHTNKNANNNIRTAKIETIRNMEEEVQAENNKVVPFTSKSNENSSIPSGPMKIESPNIDFHNNNNANNNIRSAKDEAIEKMEDGVQSENSEIVALTSKSNEKSSSGPMKIELPNMDFLLKSKLVCYSDSSEGSDDEVSDRYCKL